jgi:hypothetical protein
MHLYQQIDNADIASIDGELGSDFTVAVVDHSFQVTWINGASFTFTKADVQDAQVFEDAFIIRNRFVRFYTLTQLEMG